MTAPLISVVAPCYNERDSLPEFCRRMRDACRATADENYEIILVNDGSTDGSWPVMQELRASDPHLVLVDLSRNHGHQTALTAGLSLARGDHILIIDADLQDPPELLSPMMEKIRQGSDVVYGQRQRRLGEGWFKRASARGFYRLLSFLTDVPIPEDTGDFRLMRRRVLDALCAMPEAHRFVRGMVAWVGFTQIPLLYDRDPRHAGQTHYPLGRMVQFALDAITSFSIKPLRLSMLAAALGVVLAVLVALYALYSFIWLDAVPGWTSLVFMFLIFSALQLFSLGVIGEYLGRTYMQTKSRPLFTIRAIEGRHADQRLDSA